MTRPNWMCMVCGWRWFVLPKNFTNKLYTQCPACGSHNTKGDFE